MTSRTATCSATIDPQCGRSGGKPKALQAGNVMRVLADLGVQRLVGERLAPDVVAGCSRALSNAYLEMMEGQYLDMDFEGRTDIDTASYLEMVARKTGALIRCSMHMGSLVGQRQCGDRTGDVAVRPLSGLGYHSR